MLEWEQTRLDAGAIRYRTDGGEPASYSGVLDAWHGDASFAAAFSRLLAGIPFSAYLWETPPVAASSLHQPFEFTAIDCPQLRRAPDESPFRRQISQARPGSITTFSNLGGDATLVVPCPGGAARDYSHLAAFCRDAPTDQQVELWRTVANAMRARIGTEPVWLSTSGLGVAWLHVRIDDTPKYYAHAPYRRHPAAND